MAAVSTLGWPKGTSSSVLFHYNCASLPFLEVGMMPWRIKHCSLQTPEELIFYGTYSTSLLVGMSIDNLLGIL